VDRLEHVKCIKFNTNFLTVSYFNYTQSKTSFSRDRIMIVNNYQHLVSILGYPITLIERVKIVR